MVAEDDYGFLSRPFWIVQIRCRKPVNTKRGRDEGLKTIHTMDVARASDGYDLATALERANALAAEHVAKPVGGVFIHKIKDVGVQWRARCRWCTEWKDGWIVGWNKSGFEKAVRNHESLPWHRDAAEAWAIAETIVLVDTSED